MKSCLIPFGALIALVPSVSALQIVNLRMENATLDLAAQNPNDNYYHWINEDWEISSPTHNPHNDRFDMPQTGLAGNPWFSGSTYYSGSKALGLRIYENNGSDRDRSELRAVHGVDKPFKLKFNQQRYFGYALYIHPNTTAATPANSSQYCHITQAWQRGASFVPFTVSLFDHNGDLAMRAEARQENGSGYKRFELMDYDGVEGKGDVGEPASNTAPHTLAKGVWHTFVFYFKPRHIGYSSKGKIIIWHNGTQIVNWSGYYGKEPDGTAVDGMDCRVGVYRRQQDRKHILFVDNVRFGTTQAEATP